MFKKNTIRKQVIDYVNKKIDESEKALEMEIERIQAEAKEQIEKKEKELVDKFISFLN